MIYHRRIYGKVRVFPGCFRIGFSQKSAPFCDALAYAQSPHLPVPIRVLSPTALNSLSGRFHFVWKIKQFQEQER